MRIAITGATGFLGRYLVTHLLDAGHAIRAWHRPHSDRSGFATTGALDWLPGELGDDAAGAKLVRGCDAVVHAALDYPDDELRGPTLADFVQRNVVGTLRLVEASCAAGVPRFIFISTCAVHERILPDRRLDETHPLWPQSHYGAHKAALEAFVASYGLGQGYDICALRPTGIYGLAHPPQQSKWFDLVGAIARGADVRCTRGGKEVHALDVARAVALLLTAPGIAGQSYNCYDRYISEYDVATLTRRLTGSAARIDGGPLQPKHQIDTGRLRSLGMTFGGDARLEQTVRQLLSCV